MSKCPICDSKETSKLLSWKEFTINRCNSCRLVFTTPIPSDGELQEFYQGYMHRKPGKHEIDKRVKAKKVELAKLFQFSVEDQKTFLDFGAGIGVAFEAAKKNGLKAYYQDIDQDSIEFAKDNFDLTPDRTVEDIGTCDQKFDYIFSDNVIEHVRNPIEFVEKLISQLEEGGVLVIKTPHAANFEVFLNPLISVKGYFLSALKYNSIKTTINAFFRRFWHCDPPRHIYSFSQKSLHHLMAKSEYSQMNYNISYYTLPWFILTVTEQFFSRDKNLNPFQSIILRLIIWPIIPIEILLQMTQKLLIKAGIISPAGIILKVYKKQSIL